MQSKRVEYRDGYTLHRGHWFKMFVEPVFDPDRWRWCWYLGDHEDAAEMDIVDAPLPAACENYGRTVDGDTGYADSRDEAVQLGLVALAELERRATLAWIFGRIPLRWPRKMAPRRYENERKDIPGFAGHFADLTAANYGFKVFSKPRVGVQVKG